MKVAALVIWAMLIALGSAFATQSTGADEGSLSLKEGPGRDLTIARCIICHSVDYIQMNAPVMDRGRWEKTISKMADKYGAPLDQNDARAILEYLSTYYSG